MTNKTYTIQDLRNLKPCYDPIKYLAEDWSGTLIDILNVEECSFKDKLWVIIHLLDDKTNRLFAVYCARTALASEPKPDPRSVAAVDIAEKYAHGRATEAELDAAWSAARAVVKATRAAGAAARDAARGAQSAAWTLARDAVRDAVRDAAKEAATEKDKLNILKTLIDGNTRTVCPVF